MNILDFIIFLGICQGLFLGIALLTFRRGNQSANRALGALIILFAVSISDFLLYSTGLYKTVPHLIRVSDPVVLLFGPLFWLYVKVLTEGRYTFQWKHPISVLPFAAHVMYLAPFYLSTGAEKIAHQEQVFTQVSGVDYFISSFQVVYLFAFLWVIELIIRNHQKRIQQEFSTIERINLNWIRNIQRGLFAVFSMMAIFVVTYAVGITSMLGIHEHAQSIATYTIALMVSYYIYSMGYNGLRQPEIFTGEVLDSNDRDQVRKYERSTLQSDQAEQYAQTVRKIMEDKKPYTESDLTLQQLARTAGIPSYHLSQVLNERLGQNFYDYINRYRVEEAKRRILDPQYSHLTILAIANDVGFNSKSVFNTAFKKYTGMTPSQFRQTVVELSN